MMSWHNIYFIQVGRTIYWHPGIWSHHSSFGCKRAEQQPYWRVVAANISMSYQKSDGDSSHQNLPMSEISIYGCRGATYKCSIFSRSTWMFTIPSLALHCAHLPDNLQATAPLQHYLFLTKRMSNYTCVLSSKGQLLVLLNTSQRAKNKHTCYSPGTV